MTRERGSEVKRYLQQIGRAGGAARAAALTPAQKRKIARLGGRAAWANVSADERSKRMRAVISARWAKKRKKN